MISAAAEEAIAVDLAPRPKPRLVINKPRLFASIIVFFGLLGAAGAVLGTRLDKVGLPGALSPRAASLVAAKAPAKANPFELNEFSPIPHDAEADSVRLANAKIPFTRSALGLASPFFLSTALPTDRARAIDCLAAAAYYEAGRGEREERAVVQVVLNRLRHSAFPHTVCGVVFQGSERSTGCQFTFTCDGAMNRRRPSPVAWEFARRMATEALDGRVDPTVGLATHYHTDWVLPNWSPQMNKVASVDTHLFFQWKGSFGGPGAFGTRYAGSEPLIGKMRGISAAHGGVTLVADPAVALLAQPEIGTSSFPLSTAPVGPEKLADRSSDPDSDVLLVALQPGAADSYLAQAQQACAGKSYCKFIGWTNPGRKADKLPMAGSAIDAISFTFTRYSGSDSDVARWNCKEFDRTDKSQCLRR